MADDKDIRSELIKFLSGSFTHKSIFEAVQDFPSKYYNAKPDHIPYTFWQLLEHIRIANWDMISFINNPDYKEIEWPKDYWPSPEEKANQDLWDNSLSQIKKDLKTLENIIGDNSIKLTDPFPHGKGQNLLREFLQVIDHTGYHTGEFILMRRLMNIW